MTTILDLLVNHYGVVAAFVLGLVGKNKLSAYYSKIVTFLHSKL